jgi:lipopolysaccharide assembly protein A
MVRALSGLFFVATFLAILLFAIQNLASVTLTFLSYSVQAPLALAVIAAYLIGMVTGSALIGSMRRSFQEVTTTHRR